jgi:AraC family transcriptional regulator of adaptative response/methylated-DNA-[protein]-cysteine methyltransferase
MRVVHNGAQVTTDVPATFAGITTTKVFGRLSCASGKRARPEHRVFFATWDDAIAAGYRPCRVCRPLRENG